MVTQKVFSEKIDSIATLGNPRVCRGRDRASCRLKVNGVKEMAA